MIIEEVAVAFEVCPLEIMAPIRHGAADKARKLCMQEIQRRERIAPRMVAWIFNRDQPTVSAILKGRKRKHAP